MSRRTMLLAVLTACAARQPPPISPVRFANAPPVWLVDDRRDVAEAPAERPDVEGLRAFDQAVTRRLEHAIVSPPHRRALGVNSLDEVPTSTWFENRVGVREVSVDEIARGPGDGRGPDRSAPLRVIQAKTVGAIPGFRVEDAAGVKWMVKLEPTGVAAESAADVTVQRLFWLAGYNVPENHSGYLAREDLVLGEDATVKEPDGGKRPMTEADLEAAMDRAKAGADGRYRVLFSRMVDGEPLGPTPQVGVRDDDPNDVIPHERRRELRGLEVFAGWVQHTDFREMGTLDVWADDPVAPGHKTVTHYLLDFGNTLGLYAMLNRPDDGQVERAVDVTHVRSFFSFGLWRRPWEGVRDPDIPGVGAFDVEHFDPGDFTPFTPYRPFLDADAADAGWAVRILLAITPAQIRAALEAAQYEDPRAVDYLLEVLVGRQRKTARYWLARTSPLDRFAIEGDRLCFTDLMIAHGLDPDATRGTRYRVRGFDWSAAPIGAIRATRPARAGRACATVPEARDHDGYTIVRIEVERPGDDPPAVEVHLARDDAGDRQVIGIERSPPP